MTGRQDSEREAYWRGVIRDQRASDQSISAFCRKHAVTQGSFFYWRSKLTGRRPKKLAIRQDKTPHQVGSRNNTAAKFVPIELQAPPETTRVVCEVVLPDGCRIVVPTQCDSAWLSELLGALRDRSC